MGDFLSEIKLFLEHAPSWQLQPPMPLLTLRPTPVDSPGPRHPNAVLGGSRRDLIAEHGLKNFKSGVALFFFGHAIPRSNPGINLVNPAGGPNLIT